MLKKGLGILSMNIKSNFNRININKNKKIDYFKYLIILFILYIKNLVLITSFYKKN